MSSFILGAAIGAMLLAVVYDSAMDSGKASCERNLPRTEKCVMRWTPATEAPK